MTLISRLKEKSVGIRDVDALRDLFSFEIRALGYRGFDAFCLRTGSEATPDQPTNYFICDYGWDPIEEYLTQNWCVSDPSMVKISRSVVPFDYVAFLRSEKKTGAVLFQLGYLKLFQIERAWSIPLNTVGMIRGMTYYMTGKGAEAEKRFHETRDDLQLASIHFMEVYERIANDVPSSAGAAHISDALAEKEMLCLHWVARGKTNWEISQIMDISENTVRYYLKQSFRKLNVNSRSQAVTAALQIGVIEA